MKLIDRFKNMFLYKDKYKTHSEAVIVACYFNPQNNPYRLKAFKIFYESIKHLNHRIIECVIGEGIPELKDIVLDGSRKTVYTKNLLWHKETLLNNAIAFLPQEYKYVFWLDADVIFSNNDWLLESVKTLQTNNICQPFEYCVHLEQDETLPSFNIERERQLIKYHELNPSFKHAKMWRSFSSNHEIGLSSDKNYDRHGHVGFAWGARREILDAVPLYDRALIGGSDHLIAHAAAGHIGHLCITKSFTDDIDAVNRWSRNFFSAVQGKIGYASGDLYHIWHGDIANRQYLKRIQDFTATTKTITERDSNGLYITDDCEANKYIKEYFDKREVKPITLDEMVSEVVRNIDKNNEKQSKRILLRCLHPDANESFIESLLIGYATDSAIMGAAIGGNPMGAMLGDILNDGLEQSPIQDIMGGGEFGGGGAGGDYESNIENFDSDNFS